MAKELKILFAPTADESAGISVLLVGEDGSLGAFARKIDNECGGLVRRAIETLAFTGKKYSSFDIMVSKVSAVRHILLVGLGEVGKLAADDWLKLGATVMGRLNVKINHSVTVVMEKPEGEAESWATAKETGLFIEGLQFGHYRFDKYKTKNKVAGDNAFKSGVCIVLPDYAEAEKLYLPLGDVMNGVSWTRDLVNEPANVLGTEEFTEQVRLLGELGIEIDVLDETDMRKLGMNALLAVAQGSVRPPRIVVMRWNGYDETTQPIAFVGKGVVFDSGGISLKPAAGMEEMKGDMAGAATVVGLMWGLAKRKARVNVVGVIGLVENMPDGNAQRPGDIVVSMSGQTIEVINTDAEGRLVLADALWYTQDRFKPSCMINVATLTGAVVVALGRSYAGMFSNNDDLAKQLIEAGHESGEKVWRLPLDAEYKQLLDSSFADMKNIGGKYASAGSIVAAQFLQCHVNGIAWAHIDIAGTATKRWGTGDGPVQASGFGVRLLDRLVAIRFEQ